MFETYCYTSSNTIPIQSNCCANIAECDVNPQQTKLSNQPCFDVDHSATYIYDFEVELIPISKIWYTFDPL